MSKGLAAFLAFVAIVVLFLAAVALFLGGNVVRFVLHEQRGDAPFVMINLLEFPDATAERSYVESYGQPTLETIETLGGRLVWTGRTEALLVGNASDLWPVLAFVEYPSRASFIDMVTSSEYRARLDAREAALGRTAVFAGTPRFPFDADAAQTYVVRFTRLGEGAGYADFEDRWGREEHRLLDRHGGSLAWSADLNPLVAGDDEQFDRISVMAFPSVVAASAWGSDPERETLASLEGRLLDRDVILIARSTDDFGWRAASAASPMEHPRQVELVELAEVGKRQRLDRGNLDEARVR